MAQMQWLRNTSNARLDGAQALQNAIRNSQIRNAVTALDNNNNNNNQTTDEQRNRDRDRHEVVFPVLANDFDADPRGALLRNIDPTLRRENVEQWADDNLDNVVSHMQNARATDAEMKTNPHYLFLQQVLSFIQDDNSKLNEQVKWGSHSNTAPQATGHAQPNIRITVDTPGADAARQEQQAGGVRLGAAARPTAVQPGDMVFASGTMAAGASAVVAANARHTLDAPQTTGRFTPTDQLTAICNDAISSLFKENRTVFANSTLDMFIQDPDVRTAFAGLVGETYLLNKLKSPNRKQFIFASDYDHKVKSRKACIRNLSNNLHKVGNNFQFIPQNLKKTNLYKYSSLIQEWN